MKIIILNVKYSPNLGDGVIAECFEGALRRRLPDASISSCDLAGREDFGEGLNKSRGLVNFVLDRLPGPLRRRLVPFLLSRVVKTRLAGHYEKTLEGADAVILGGGQLLADSDLNFPLKINAALKAAQSAGAWIFVYGVGVASSWSARGQALFSEVLAGADYVAVRDRASAERYEMHLQQPVDAVVWDTGLLSARQYGRSEREEGRQRTVGVCITHPSTLGAHADDGAVASVNYMSSFTEIAERLVEAGWAATLFTNGAHDDQAFLEKIAERCAPKYSGNIKTAAALRTPGELCRLISSFDAVIAHRLHANIVAYSYDKPHIGLGWDSKLPAFFKSIGREQYAISADKQSPDEIISALESAFADPASAKRKAEVMSDAERQLDELVERISNSVEGCARETSV